MARGAFYFDITRTSVHNLDMNVAFDAHCHFYESGLPQGVGGVITNAAQYTDWDKVISVADSYNGIYGAIGIHPWHVQDIPDNWGQLLESYLINNPDLMVGEIGLDKNHPDTEKQIAIFIQQMHIANKTKRGVHVHCVGMWPTMRQILNEHDFSSVPFILFHRYSGASGDIAWLIKKHNAYFSYRAIDNTDKILAIPVDRLLVESDSNNPKQCTEWTTTMAQVCEVEPDTFTNNAKRMIKNGQII